ncbi:MULTISPECIES: hypothetical protein [unclassified Streptomyces]|uniref:hypothetical protein n=1 Tax=unclassified Streptomyces TaxID=2593676 RepID=UPI00088BCA3C|nr:MULTISPECIES: hypothetical protein [unclassified Streptomyces]PBC72262.1 hypothetical protein BX261_7346 [Streptomyces sp. 2321.6]SDR61924.1 hypothetical protein SAMN05216511_7223 [Streptomyces sp. KS_16]SEE48922.1 hypothetical protein SAMN05428940_7272 [Streptomyces sp. 2133.1]SNC77767.1 hypothetical protein SAMN06272741_7183 [Streptomyces sp. 2114.4]
MRPHRLMEFVVDALGKAPEVQRAEAWQEGTTRPAGVHVTFITGSELWLAITGGRPGDDHSQPEVPVTDAPPAEMPVPDLLRNGKITPSSAEAYLAAVLNNSGSAEIKRTYAYSADATPTVHPGVGIEFHSEAKGWMPFVHTARPGQGKGSRAFDLQDAF